VQFKAASATTWTPSTVSTPSFPMSGLTPNTVYQVRVQADCGNGSASLWTEAVSFTTLPEDTPEPCDAPTNLRESGIIFDKALGILDVVWDNPGGASQWNLQYSLESESAWNTVTVNEPHCMLDNLEGGSTYVIRVQAVCDNGTLSDWSNTLTAVAQTVGVENYLENSVVLFPNPAKEYVDIRVDGGLNVTMMEVYDVYGKLINTVNMIDNPTRINVSGLADGMYFVRVTTEEGVVTKTFVKQ
jgi:hypothetical protein